MVLYDFKVKGLKGEDVSLADYKGKTLLIVNTAIKCGLTPQYDSLESLYQKYNDMGFEILDFPCNQFMGQAPGSDEDINQFCELNYHTSFPRFSKIDVNGANADPLFVWLKDRAPNSLLDDDAKDFEEKIKSITPAKKPEDIKWNFGKFLIGKRGDVIARYSPAYNIETIDKDVADALK